MAYFSVSNPSTNILPPITPAVLKKAIELIDNGASIRQAADILGVPPRQLRSKLPSKEEKSLKERALDSIVAVQGRICSTVERICSTVEDGNKTTRKGFAGASTCTESTLKVVNKLIPGDDKSVEDDASNVVFETTSSTAINQASPSALSEEPSDERNDSSQNSPILISPLKAKIKNPSPSPNGASGCAPLPSCSMTMTTAASNTPRTSLKLSSQGSISIQPKSKQSQSKMFPIERLLHDMSTSHAPVVSWHSNPFPKTAPKSNQNWIIPNGSPIRLVDNSTLTQTANVSSTEEEFFIARLQQPLCEDDEDSYVEWCFTAPQGRAAVGVVKGVISQLQGPLGKGDSCMYSESGRIYGGTPSTDSTAFSVEQGAFGPAWKGGETFGVGVRSGKLVFTRFSDGTMHKCVVNDFKPNNCFLVVIISGWGTALEMNVTPNFEEQQRDGLFQPCPGLSLFTKGTNKKRSTSVLAVDSSTRKRRKVAPTKWLAKFKIQHVQELVTGGYADSWAHMALLDNEKLAALGVSKIADRELIIHTSQQMKK